MFNPVGVGIVLHPNGVGVLKQLGLGGELADAGNVVRRMEIIRGQDVMTIDLAEVWGGEPTIAILRTELHELLLRRAFPHKSSVPQMHMGCRIAGVESVERRPVISFADGRKQTYDLIIGADGVHSVLRQSLFPGSEAVSTGLLYFRFAAHNVIALEPDVWRTVECADASYGFIPVGHNRLHCFVQLSTTENPCPAGQEEAYFRAAFGPLNHALVEAMDARCGPIHVGFAYMVRPVQWGRGRCVLMGDASHAVSPTLSEGGSLAMEDALVLARALRKNKSINAAISAYNQARCERVQWTYRMSLAQVNAASRRRMRTQISSEVATNHMRKMYEPLRSSPVPESWC